MRQANAKAILERMGVNAAHDGSGASLESVNPATGAAQGRIRAATRAEYDERVEQLELCADNPDECRGEIATPQYQRIQQKALDAERETIIHLRNQRVINDDALRRIQRDLDLAEARLSGG